VIEKLRTTPKYSLANESRRHNQQQKRRRKIKIVDVDPRFVKETHPKIE
jgi:hypothetical protein